MSGPIPEISAADAHHAVESGTALLVDVRERDEWVAGHAPAARHVPMGDIDRPDVVPHDMPVILVCRSGRRSALVTEVLCRAGCDASNLAGGMKAWLAAGLPLVAADGTPGAVI
jgi:rhodanese-related sulfurtransferase